MTDTAVKTLQEQRLKAWNEMKDILVAARAEGRAMTGEETQRYTALEGEMKSCGDTIDAELRQAKIDAVMNAPAPTPGVPTADADPAGRAARTSEYDDVFKRYLRRGVAGMRDEHVSLLERRSISNSVEYRDMGEASNSAGGYLVPPGFLSKITEVLKWFGGVRLVANAIETTTGQSLVWPVNDDTSNGATIIGENTQVGETDLTFTQKTLSAFMWTTGAVRIGRALMQDSAFDLESVVGDRFGKRLGRGQNTAFTLGTGITGGLTSATDSGVTFDGTSDPFTQANAGVVIKNLLALIHSVDAAYRQSGRCVFMMNDQSVTKVQGLVDANNRPLFVPAGSFGSIINGVLAKNLDLGGGVDTLL